jgi:hypothetical protein
MFGDLKGDTAAFTADSPAEILSEIRRIFQESQERPSWLCVTNGSQGSSGYESTNLLSLSMAFSRNDFKFSGVIKPESINHLDRTRNAI